MSKRETSADSIRNWRNLIFSSVAELGDLDYQRATWLDPEMQNPHFTFVEFFECFYDAAGGSYDAKEYDADDAPFTHKVGAGILSETERDLVWPVHLALSSYSTNDDYDHAAILSDPSWQNVVETASVATERLRKSFTSDRDLKALVNELPSPEVKRWP